MDLFKISEPIIYYKSSEQMVEVVDNSIQLIITSPPYGKIKDYGADSQIGFTDTFEEYFSRLKLVWKECYRVLEPQCRLVINVGDQYLRTSEYGRYRILSIASKIITDCSDIGFDFLGDIIWQKVSTTNTTGGCTLMGSIYYPRNGLLTYDYEHILIFKKHEGKERKTQIEIKELSKIPLTEWKKWYVGHWNFPGILQKEHVAMFPEELPYRLIRMFSYIHDTILDPFAGSGTTLKVAKALFRKSIGYEINPMFKTVIEQKIKDINPRYFQDFQYLLYILYKKSEKELLEICYKQQQQKGIIVLKNAKNEEIILDYLLISNEKFDRIEFLGEFQSKFEENTVKNYLNQNKGWEEYSNYLIIINTNYPNHREYLPIAEDFIKSQIASKKISLVPYATIIDPHYDLTSLF